MVSAILFFHVSQCAFLPYFRPFFWNFILFCREPRGFGFIQYVDPSDAAEAKYHMDGQILLGRRLTVVFAEENRKKPGDMRARESGGRYVFSLSHTHTSNSLYFTFIIGPISINLFRFGLRCK